MSRVARLDSLLARNLGWTRAEARRLLDADDVHLSSHTSTFDPRQPIDVSALPLTLTIGERSIELYDTYHLVLNKPAGYVTALRDSQHPTAHELVQDAPLADELRAVGRLDLDTTGLLLWTTDGVLLQRWTHPKRHVPRTYQAALASSFRSLPSPFVLDDGHQPHVTSLDVIEDESSLHPSLIRPENASLYASITIVGGAYHEVRRIFAALGSHVLSLCRVSFGRLHLPADLAPGAHRPVTPDDV